MKEEDTIEKLKSAKEDTGLQTIEVKGNPLAWVAKFNELMTTKPQNIAITMSDIRIMIAGKWMTLK